MTVTDVLVTANDAGEFGGGAIHYCTLDLGALALVGATNVTADTAGTAGPDVFTSEVSRSDLGILSAHGASEPIVPDGWNR